MLHGLLAMSLMLAAGQTSLERAEAAYDDLAFEDAAKLFRKALSEPGAREDRIRAYRGLALAEAFLGKTKLAQQHFETLLLLAPDATVNQSLGPKISRPFEAAKKAVRGARPEVRVQRDERSGTVSATLSEVPDAVDVLVLHVSADGQLEQQAKGLVPKVEVAPELNVEAWAEALDEGKGVLFEAGSQKAPLKFPATARPAAVAAAVEEAHAQGLQEYGQEEEEVTPASTRWPLWVGGAVAVVGGGVAAAYLLTRSDPLQLPAADRTGRLP